MRALLLLSSLTLLGCYAYAAPVLVQPLPDGKAAMTYCSWNNLPIILIDPQTVLSPDRELILLHETIHVEDALASKGGCWPFLYRYTSDKLFRIKTEYKAYCIEGQLALQRNKRPEDIWNRVKFALQADTTLTNMSNCIYEP
jgi:hypothetical protein